MINVLRWGTLTYLSYKQTSFTGLNTLNKVIRLRPDWMSKMHSCWDNHSRATTNTGKNIQTKIANSSFANCHKNEVQNQKQIGINT